MRLQSLTIKNFILIDYAELLPAAGFTVLTGETGAGKSIIIDALEFLSGKKSADRSFVRTGAAEMVVSALFIDDFGREMVVERGVPLKGRSYVKIDGVLKSQKELAERLDGVFAVHSQNEQQKIFEAAQHQKLLDAFAGRKADAMLANYQEILAKIKKNLSARAKLGKDPHERQQKAEMLRFYIDDITQNLPQVGEESILLQKLKRYKALEILYTSLAKTGEYLSDENGALAALKNSVAAIRISSKISAKSREIEERLIASVEEIDDLAHDLKKILAHVAYDEADLNYCNERLTILHKLFAKYGKDENAVLQYLKVAKSELQALEDSETRFAELSRELEKLFAELTQAANALLTTRREAADNLAAAVKRELADVNLPFADFTVQIVSQDLKKLPADPHKVEFLFSANTGEELKPLVNIASGGEASRILLVLQSVLSDVDDISTVVFDEIDTGISGNTANKVAEKIRHISQKHQVLCVTHSAQIAAVASEHFLIEKLVSANRTTTVLHKLDKVSRQNEIARLLAGDKGRDSSLKLAKELLDSDVEPVSDKNNLGMG